MAKVRIAVVRKRAARVARTKHVRGPKGKQVKLFAVDSNDDNFDEELTHVFRLNIASARQANTAIFGSPDGPKKSAKRVQRATLKLK
jgi:hypothetical protein